MERKKYVLNEGEGSLWHETNCTVVRKGKIMINGSERYASILKYSSPNSPDKYELAISAGLLRIIPDEEKRDINKSPDISGLINFNDETYKFGGWRKVKEETGQEWTNVKIDKEMVKLKEGNTSDNKEEAPF